MPKVSNVEKKIKEKEGFAVHFLNPETGRNLRGDAELPTQYAAKKMTRNSFTVSDFKIKLRTQYAGYDVVVCKSDMSKAPGQMKLSTLRDTYLPEENL